MRSFLTVLVSMFLAVVFCLFMARESVAGDPASVASGSSVTKPNNFQLNSQPSAGKRVSDFVATDGQIDLEAIRASGYQGVLDANGLDMRVSPQGLRSSAIASTATPPPTDPDDIYWDNSLSPSVSGVAARPQVLAMVVYDGKLIVGFEGVAAGEVIANHIAAWDGASWSALGSGLPGFVLDLEVYDGKLIAGGALDTQTIHLSLVLRRGMVQHGRLWVRVFRAPSTPCASMITS